MSDSTHEMPPTRPQPVYRPSPTFTPVQPDAPQVTPASQLPPPAYHQEVPLPPPPTAQDQEHSQRMRRELAVAGAVIGGISLVVAIIVVGVQSTSNSSSGTTGNVAGDNGQVAPVCYATAEGIGSPFTIAEMGTTDCTAIATAADFSLASIGYRATPNTSMGPGNAICNGMVNGNTVTVIATEPDPALCYRLGLDPF